MKWKNITNGKIVKVT